MRALMITHNTHLADAGDKSYRVTMTNGISEVTQA